MSEELITKTESYFKTIFESISESVLLINNEGIILLFNNKSKENVLQHLSRELKIGANALNFVEELNIPFFKTVLLRVSNGESVIFENEYNSLTGEKVSTQFSINPIYTKNKVTEICITGRDITKSKIEEYQKEFEKRDKEALINSTEDLIWSVTRDFRLIAANKSFINNMYASTGQIIKSGDDLLLKDAYNPAFLEYWKTAYIKTFAGQPLKEEVFVPASKNAADTWWEINLNPITNNGSIDAIACYARNITERKLIEEQIRQSEERLATAQTVAKVGSWETDLTSFKVTWSAETYRIFGVDPKSPTFHEGFLEYVHDADRDEVEKAFRDSIDYASSINNIEHRIITPEGIIKDVEERWHVVRDSNNHPVKAIGTCQDITEKKKAEAHSMATTEELRNLYRYLQNVREDERKRIAREIHDELGQQLTAIKMDISWLKKKLPELNETNEQKIKDLFCLIDNSINTVRRIASELRPGILDDLGLVEAIKWQINEFTNRTGIHVQFFSNIEDEKFSPDITITVFRIFQESLTNIARHAHASVVSCEFLKHDDHLKLT